MNGFAWRRLGFIGWERRGVRFRRWELSIGWALGFGYSVYHESANLWISPVVFTFFLNVPMVIKQRSGTEDWDAHYGWSLHKDAIHLNWRDKSKVLWTPWKHDWLSTEILDDGGAVVYLETKATRAKGLDAFAERMARERAAVATVAHSYPYRYVLRSGKVQNVTATVHVTRMSWGLRWWPWPVKVRTYIDIAFDGEVGEQAGSWKGGTVGCSYTMAPEETSEQALRRMEQERRFD